MSAQRPSITNGNGFYTDAASGRDSAAHGGFTPVGVGCSTGNGTMNLRSSFLTNGATNKLDPSWTVAQGPSNQTAAVLVGATNPNLLVSNLCPLNGAKYLYTDVAFFVLSGSTDALGFWTIPAISVAWAPFYAGVKLTAQAAAVDIGQGGIGVAASNGITSEVAPVPVPIQLSRLYNQGSANATAATGTLHVGFGTIVQFRY